MYCPNCRIKVEQESPFCPVCGRRMSPSEFNAGAIIDDAVFTDQRQFGSKREIRFNFSKPLCLVFALLLIGSMLLPWFGTAYHDQTVDYRDPNEYRFYEIGEAVKGYLCNRDGMDEGTECGDLLWQIPDEALDAIKPYFAVCAGLLLVFGVVGVITKGRLRYVFAFSGGALHSIGLIAVIAALLIRKVETANAVSRLAEGANAAYYDVMPTAWLYVSAALSLLFLFAGVRLLRYLNGISCLNRGDYRTAEREFMIIHCVKKLPRTFSRAKLRRGVRYSSKYGDERSYDDSVL